MHSLGLHSYGWEQTRPAQKKVQRHLFWTKCWPCILRWKNKVPGFGSERKKEYKIEGMGGRQEMEKEQAMSIRRLGTGHRGGCHPKSNSKCITKQLGVFKAINTDYRHIFCYRRYITHKA